MGEPSRRLKCHARVPLVVRPRGDRAALLPGGRLSAAACRPPSTRAAGGAAGELVRWLRCSHVLARGRAVRSGCEKEGRSGAATCAHPSEGGKPATIDVSEQPVASEAVAAVDDCDATVKKEVAFWRSSRSRRGRTADRAPYAGSARGRCLGRGAR